jgi:hypothetical protein
MADRNPLNRDVNHRRISVGASLNLEEALTRCLTEEVQGDTQAEYLRQDEYDRLWDHLPHLNLGHAYDPARNIRHPAEFRMFLQRYLTVGDLAFLDKDAPTIGIGDLTFRAAQDFQADIESLLTICESFGKDIYVVDHTHPVLAFPAVRVIVPGMSTIFSQAFPDHGIRTYADYRAFFDNLWYPGLVEAVRAAFREQRDFRGFVAGMEKHLSHYPYDYALPCRNYGMRDTNIYDILSSLCLRQSDFDRSRRYSLFVKEVFHGSGNDHCSEGISLPTSRNPFLNQCKCQTCQILRPSLTNKAIQSLITVG